MTTTVTHSSWRLLGRAIALAVIVSFAIGGSLQADEKPDKEPGVYYLGGTAGLSGIDAKRGWIDSVYYAKWQGLIPPAGALEKVIYGNDDRLDVYEVTDPNLLMLAQAACIVTDAFNVSDNGDGTYDISTSTWTSISGSPLCSGEPFAGQLQAGWCSAFLVGQDLLVTAGHCVSVSDCGSVAFIFGFQQIDATTPPLTTVSEDNIYFCAEVIDRVYAGDLDYCVIRLDRPVVERTPIPIRHSGVVSNGDSLVVVGHPTGLPLKVSGGAIVQDNNADTLAWFQSNLDTYGGNSGSMVVNTSTWVIEGILVRGAPDFVFTGGCWESNRVPDTGNEGSGLEFEEVSTSTSFAAFVPELVNSTGAINIIGTMYNCDDVVDIQLADLDLGGLGTYAVLVTSSSGDAETIVLTESATLGIFDGSVSTASGAPSTEDGLLQTADGDLVTVVYNDADDGTGNPATVQDDGTLDCLPAVITTVTVIDMGGTWAQISFITDELASGQVDAGATCGSLTLTGSGGTTMAHTVTINGLSPLTTYKFTASATDLAGNPSSDDNGGACYELTTLDQPDYYTEQFSSGENDLVATSTIFTPDGSISFYEACRDDTVGFPTVPGSGTGATLSPGDDSSEEVFLTGGELISLYGVTYGSIFVSSNGCLTLGASDVDYTETVPEHFGPDPRIAVYWDDFNPTAGGSISYDQFADRLVVSWVDVPEYSTTNSNSFQAELYFDGRIVLTHVLMAATDGLVGLSDGSGEPADFVESDLTAYGPCVVEPPGCCVDFTGNILLEPDCVPTDEVVDVQDLTNMIDHLFIDFDPICCAEEADFSSETPMVPDGITDNFDLTSLIDHLFINFPVLPDCP